MGQGNARQLRSMQSLSRIFRQVDKPAARSYCGPIQTTQVIDEPSPKNTIKVIVTDTGRPVFVPAQEFIPGRPWRLGGVIPHPTTRPNRHVIICGSPAACLLWRMALKPSASPPSTSREVASCIWESECCPSYLYGDRKWTQSPNEKNAY